MSVAWRVAAGGRSVALVDPEPGRGATWAAAGMLAPVGEAHFGEEDLARLNLAAAAAWPMFARELEAASGQLVHYRGDGTLVVAGGPSDRSATGINGGVDLPADHQVDNRAVAVALQTACREAGVAMVADRAIRVDTIDQRAVGVELEHGGRLPATTVVVAAGSHSGGIDGIPEGWSPPVRPVRGVTVRLRAPDGAPRLRRTVRALVHGRSCYLVPRDDGGVVLGATVEERGFSLDIPLGGLADLIEDARRVVPVLDEYALVEVTPGLRPGSPDNGPIVGSTSIEGLMMATGHYRNGVLLAPATADEVLRLLTARDDGVDAAPGSFDAFRPERFVGTVVR
jgi:glycine oxidase